MTIYGVALLAICYIIGQLAGDWLGQLLNVEANVGGVGFAMLLLILANTWLEKHRLKNIHTELGINFWSQMYIPIVVAMAASQNVKAAISGGFISLAAGILPVVLSYMAIPLLAKFFKNTES